MGRGYCYFRSLFASEYSVVVVLFYDTQTFSLSSVENGAGGIIILDPCSPLSSLNFFFLQYTSEASYSVLLIV